MGLKIGKWLKKNVRLTNVVKMAGNLAPGLAGSVVTGLQDAHYAKKQAKAEQDAIRQQQLMEIASQKAQSAGQKVGEASRSILGDFANSAYKGASPGVKDALGHIGLQVGQRSVSIWLKKNAGKVIGGVIGIIVLIFGYRMMSNRKRSRR